MKKFFTAALVAVFFYCAHCSGYAPEGKIFVTMIDIGQGDAFLIETAEQNILIDTGDVMTRKQLVDALTAAGVTRLEKIILTHAHADHIGGVQAVLKNFSVDVIIDNGFPASSPLYKKYRAANINHSSVSAGDVLDFGGGARFEILSPDRIHSNVNNQSIVGRLVFGEFSVLFTGDAEAPVEKNLLGQDVHATILKAGHHGSKSANTEKFIRAVNPEFVIISCGMGNSYGHPHIRPLKTFRKFVPAENIFCTMFNGSVRAVSDGFDVEISADFNAPWVDEYIKEAA